MFGVKATAAWQDERFQRTPFVPTLFCGLNDRQVYLRGAAITYRKISSDRYEPVALQR